MSVLRWRLVAVALGLVGALAEPETRVLLLRHCPRAPYPSDRHPPLPPNNFTSPDNFSSQPFPSADQWQAAPGRCTPTGLELARRVGAALSSMLGSQRAEVFADKVPRCVATAAALGVNATEVAVDQVLFDPLSAKLQGCAQPNWQGTLTAEVNRSRSQLQEARTMLPKLQALLGQGVAAPLDQIPDTVSGGYFVGGLRVASESIVETFDLERTSNLTVGWGKVPDSDFRLWSRLRAAYFRVMYGVGDIAQRYASGPLAKLLQQQLPPWTVLLGHDLNVVAVRSLLGLSWQCGIWSKDANPPLAGVMFVMTETSVRAEVVCANLGEGEAAIIKPASFADGHSEMPRAQFENLVRSQIEWRCVNQSAQEAVSALFV